MDRQQPEKTATDWDRYYTSVPPTARLTRKYTTRVLLDAIRKYVAPRSDAPLAVAEIGGANSCFLDAIVGALNPRSYDVIDTNEYGLSLLAKKLNGARGVLRIHCQNVLALSYGGPADLVFSIGLVEHFEPAETRKAVLAHFDPLAPGGVVIISFPTPTLLYRISRRFLEVIGMWKFPDERPLNPPEVLATIRERGDVLHEKTLWPLVLTQHVVVARKR